MAPLIFLYEVIRLVINPILLISIWKLDEKIFDGSFLSLRSQANSDILVLWVFPMRYFLCTMFSPSYCAVFSPISFQFIFSFSAVDIFVREFVCFKLLYDKSSEFCIFICVHSTLVFIPLRIISYSHMELTGNQR